MARLSLNVNGKNRVVDTDPATPLLYVLRGDLDLNGPKFGCGLAQDESSARTTAASSSTPTASGIKPKATSFRA